MTLSKDIDLLLIGKIGTGKSALGNTILRRKAFISENGPEALTTRVSCEVSEYNGRIIKVVDCPGVEDKCHWTEGSFNRVLKALKEAVTINPRGYHAFILVARYGGRFTDEDQGVVDFLKNIFGDSFVIFLFSLVETILTGKLSRKVLKIGVTNNKDILRSLSQNAAIGSSYSTIALKIQPPKTPS